MAQAAKTVATTPAADDIRDRPVMFIDELAAKLGTSPRTIQRQLRAGTFFIEELPKVDHRHRWSRARVYIAIASETGRRRIKY